MSCDDADLLDNSLKEGRKVLGQGLRRPPSDAVHAAGIHHGEVALLVSGAQLAEEVKCGVDDKVGPADGCSHLGLLSPQRVRTLSQIEVAAHTGVCIHSSCSDTYQHGWQTNMMCSEGMGSRGTLQLACQSC